MSDFICFFSVIDIGSSLICIICSHAVCSLGIDLDRSGNIDTCTSALFDALRVVDSLRDFDEVCRLYVLDEVPVWRILIVASNN